jgi:purine catabolism regulator
VVTARELALELQLTGSTDRDGLAAIARASLAPLIEWDARHRSELVQTLEVLLRHGNSPTRAAAALHLGRQSLYQRIERIETVLGHPVDDARLHAALLQAAVAHRLSLA